jgi:phosphate transport system protein
MSEIEPFPESELRVEYHQHLDQVRRDILRLGAMVTETIPAATEVLLNGDLEAAQRLIDGDDAIDSLSVALEEACYGILIRQSPMAGELRQVVTVVKLVAELERSADLMVNVAKAARRMHGTTLSPRIRGLVTGMSKEASKLMRFCLDSFADDDEALARALADIDDELDQLNRDMVQAIFEAHSAGWIDLTAAVQLALVARYYERVGDHAVNIGERVIYMITGWMPEHLEVLRPEQQEQQVDAEDSEPAERPPGDAPPSGQAEA